MVIRRANGTETSGFSSLTMFTSDSRQVLNHGKVSVIKVKGTLPQCIKGFAQN